MNLVLDAGALVAIDNRARHVLGVLRQAESDGRRVVTSAAVVAQVWRHGARQANLARVLSGVRVEALDDGVARELGPVLGRSGSSDVVDAHVAWLTRPGDVVLTSDPDDLRRLLGAHGVEATVSPI